MSRSHVLGSDATGRSRADEAAAPITEVGTGDPVGGFGTGPTTLTATRVVDLKT